MNTDRIAYFLAVAQTGSITLGAQKSFITQTAMSQQMAALEADQTAPPAETFTLPDGTDLLHR